MGPIQASLNQLTLSALGAVYGLSKGLKPQAKPSQESNPIKKDLQPLKPAKPGDYKVQEDIKYTIPGAQDMSVLMSDVAGRAGNDMIQQKFRARFKSVEERLKSIRKRKM